MLTIKHESIYSDTACIGHLMEFKTWKEGKKERKTQTSAGKINKRKKEGKREWKKDYKKERMNKEWNKADRNKFQAQQLPYRPTSWSVALWSGTNKNRDVSTGPLARPVARLLAPLTRSLAPDCSLRSLVCSIAHFAHSLARGTVNNWMS